MKTQYITFIKEHSQNHLGIFNRKCRVRYRMVVDSNTAQDEVYSLQHYVIKCVSDLRQVWCF
jgi:hypothetical protein